MQKKLKKASVMLLLVVFLFSMSLNVFASPDVLPGDVASTVADLITLKAPEQLTSSTTNKKLPISATAPQGTLVTVYRYNPSTGNYHKIVTNDVPLESLVGSTTLFAGQVDLTAGSNKFIIRGALDDTIYTVVNFEVNMLNEGFMNRIKSVISVIFN